MKPNWQQTLLALFLGMMLPSLTLRIGSLFPHTPPDAETEPPQILQTDTTEATESQPTIATEPPETQYSIPVLLSSDVIVDMDLDTYLVGVVLAEMPASFEMEALKAQAVVARTYAWKRMLSADHHPQGAVCVNAYCCQAYMTTEDYLINYGTQEDLGKITQAVLATTGQVLTYQGNLAEATYFSCSGGRTEDAAAVWGSEIPYLQAVDSPGEEDAAAYTETVIFTPEEFAAALGRTLSGGPQNWLGTVTWSEGGGVATMNIAGKRYTGVELRKLLDLNSTAFTILVEEGNLSITTKGKGHRVGMSQYGADAMAVLGKTAEEILSHYYPGTVIDKLSALE